MESPHREPGKPLTLGWKELVDLPEWGIHNLVAKADTGARRSAIDVCRIHEVDGDEVGFDIVLSRRGDERIHTVRCKITHVTHVRSSNGQSHERYFVKTPVRIGRVEKVIELSLVSRREMLYRVLLGRKALEGDFVVDVGKTFQMRPRTRIRLRH